MLLDILTVFFIVAGCVLLWFNVRPKPSHAVPKKSEDKNHQSPSAPLVQDNTAEHENRMFPVRRRLMHCSNVRKLSTNYAARSTRLSISLRSISKLIGLVRSASAPFSSA